MGTKALISAAIVALAAISALGIIVFNVNWRGHYVYCGLHGCLSAEAVSNFLLPFGFLFVKHSVVLFGLWFVVAIFRQIARNLSNRRRGSDGQNSSQP